MMDTGELERMELLSGKGFTRWSEFTEDQMYTFITLRALSASPLMMGGDLPTLDDFSLELITNNDVLECNRNGVMGKLVYDAGGIEIWNAPKKNSKDGWIGVFNRTPELNDVTIFIEDLGLDSSKTDDFKNVWENSQVSELYYSINSNGVVFLQYKGR